MEYVSYADGKILPVKLLNLVVTLLLLTIIYNYNWARVIFHLKWNRRVASFPLNVRIQLLRLHSFIIFLLWVCVTWAPTAMFVSRDDLVISKTWLVHRIMWTRNKLYRDSFMIWRIYISREH